jgi:hypothetical protein
LMSPINSARLTRSMLRNLVSSRLLNGLFFLRSDASASGFSSARGAAGPDGIRGLRIGEPGPSSLPLVGGNLGVGLLTEDRFLVFFETIVMPLRCVFFPSPDSCAPALAAVPLVAEADAAGFFASDLVVFAPPAVVFLAAAFFAVGFFFAPLFEADDTAPLAAAVAFFEETFFDAAFFAAGFVFAAFFFEAVAFGVVVAFRAVAFLVRTFLEAPDLLDAFPVAGFFAIAFLEAAFFALAFFAAVFADRPEPEAPADFVRFDFFFALEVLDFAERPPALDAPRD